MSPSYRRLASHSCSPRKTHPFAARAAIHFMHPGPRPHLHALTSAHSHHMFCSRLRSCAVPLFSPCSKISPPSPTASLLLARCGDVQQNPGPPLPNSHHENLMLHPSTFHSVINMVGLGYPSRDAFASHHNHQVEAYWTSTTNAFLQDWRKEPLLWVNPPFSLIPDVLQKFRQQPTPIILVTPEWHCPWRSLLLRLASRSFLLPDTAIFTPSPSYPPLPPPRWRTRISLLLPNSPMSAPATTYIPDLTCDGDVEANPGPLSPTEFLSNLGITFLQRADNTAIARRLIDLQARSSAWPPNWNLHFFPDTAHCPSMDDQLQLLTAYELYSTTTLHFTSAGPEWISDTPSEVAQLQAKIRALELRNTPPTEAELLQGPTLELIDRLSNTSGLPDWLSGALKVYSSWLSSRPTPPPNDPLLELWPCLLQAYFRPSDGSLGATSSRNPTTPKTRPAPFTVAQLKQRGGRMDTEVTPNGVVTYAYLGSKRYYLSKKGALWDTSVPPPAPCHGCGAYHWFWECTASSDPPMDTQF